MKTLLLTLLAAALASCASRTEHWTQRPTGCADTTVKRDADGNPNFGSK